MDSITDKLIEDIISSVTAHVNYIAPSIINDAHVRMDELDKTDDYYTDAELHVMYPPDTDVFYHGDKKLDDVVVCATYQYINGPHATVDGNPLYCPSHPNQNIVYCRHHNPNCHHTWPYSRTDQYIPKASNYIRVDIYGRVFKPTNNKYTTTDIKRTRLNKFTVDLLQHIDNFKIIIDNYYKYYPQRTDHTQVIMERNKLRAMKADIDRERSRLEIEKKKTEEDKQLINARRQLVDVRETEVAKLNEQCIVDAAVYKKVSNLDIQVEKLKSIISTVRMAHKQKEDIAQINLECSLKLLNNLQCELMY